MATGFVVRFAAAADFVERTGFAAGFAGVFLAVVARFAAAVAFAAAGFAALDGAAFARVAAPAGAFPLRDAEADAAFVALAAFLGGAVRTGAIGSS